MSVALQAALWGMLCGSALVLGAALGWFLRVPPRLIAACMAFGSGVLISTLALELMEEAWRRGGLAATAAGFAGGAVLYTLANAALTRYGAKHRKRSGDQQPRAAADGSSGTTARSTEARLCTPRIAKPAGIIALRIQRWVSPPGSDERSPML